MLAKKGQKLKHYSEELKMQSIQMKLEGVSHPVRIHESNAAMHDVPAIGLRLSLRALRYRLWDERSKRFVGFRSLKG